MAPEPRSNAGENAPAAIDAEIAFHLDMQIRRYVAEGMDEPAARERALGRLGDLDRVRRRCHTLETQQETVMRHTEWRQGMRQDLRYAWRVLKNAPVFTVTAIVTIALGVGCATTIFSVVNDVLLRRLPYRDADRLVVIWNSYAPTGLTYAGIAAAEYADIRETTDGFEAVAAMSSQQSTLTSDCQTTADCDPERINAYTISPNLFDVLRVSPRHGRSFTEADGAPTADKTVMLSDALWRRRFAADPTIIGRTIAVGGVPRTVVGVMPPDVRFPDAPLDSFRERADLWLPVAWEQRRAENRGNQYLTIIGRVRGDLPLSRAQTDLDTIADRFRAEYPGRYAGAALHWRMVAIPLRDQMVGSVRSELLVLLGAVGLLLLIACANVANLMMARGTTRRREFAVRSALGATRTRLVRQVLIEAMLLASLGGAAGILLAVLGVQLIARSNPGEIPRLDGAHVDAVMLAFSIGITLLCGVLVGLAPALRQSRAQPQTALGDGTRGGTHAPVRRRVRSLLVVAEVAMALVILVGAGLLIRSFSALVGIKPAFDASHAVAFELTPPHAAYDNAAKLLAFHTGVVARLAALPGVTSASAVYPLPTSGEMWSGSFFVEGRVVPPGQAGPHAEYAVSLPAYFQTMRLPVITGRDFAPTDVATAPPVVIVDEALARRYWPGEPAVGKRISATAATGPWVTIVGVVAHVRNGGPREEGEPQIYVPLLQSPQAPLYFVARTAGDPASFVGLMPGVVRSIDPKMAVAKLAPLSDTVAHAVARERFGVTLFTIFGAVALMLAAIGLYGVIAFLVTQRTEEIGIRLALGGRPGHIVRSIVGEGMVMTMAGVVVGLVAAFALSQSVAGLLFSIEPTDPITYAAIVTIFGAVAFIASYVPSRRAASVDPVTVLRR